MKSTGPRGLIDLHPPPHLVSALPDAGIVFRDVPPALIRGPPLPTGPIAGPADAAPDGNDAGPSLWLLLLMLR